MNAGECQIPQRIIPAVLPRNDVLDLEPRQDECLVHQAAFAAIAGAISDERAYRDIHQG